MEASCIFPLYQVKQRPFNKRSGILNLQADQRSDQGSCQKAQPGYGKISKAFLLATPRRKNAKMENHIQSEIQLDREHNDLNMLLAALAVNLRDLAPVIGRNGFCLVSQGRFLGYISQASVSVDQRKRSYNLARDADGATRESGVLITTPSGESFVRLDELDGFISNCQSDRE